MFYQQISSEGPLSQISRDIEDSPTSCMDHLLSMCFEGPPSEDQLLYLLTLIKRERAKPSGIAESLRLSSDSGSDDKGQRRSSRIKVAKEMEDRSRGDRQGSSLHGNESM